MNEKDDDKATAKLLLSTDEAVAEKIRRVLANNPDIIADAMKRVEETIMMQQREAEYQRALQQAMLQRERQAQGMRNVYTSNNTAGNVFPSIFGGKK